MDQPGIAVKVENDRLVHREKAVEVPIEEAMRILAGGRKLEQIDPIDEPNCQTREAHWIVRVSRCVFRVSDSVIMRTVCIRRCIRMQ